MPAKNEFKTDALEANLDAASKPMVLVMKESCA
jgi:hypothetical protein